MQNIETLFKKHLKNFLLELAADTGAEGEEVEVVATPAAKPAKPAAKPAKPAPAADAGVTLPQLRQKALAIINEGRQDEITALCAEYGAKSMSTLDPEHYEAANEALDALMV